jgi:hypothetical protein
MNPKHKISYLRALALTAEVEARQKIDAVSRLRGATNRAEEKSEDLWTEAKKLTRLADGLEKKPAVQDISSLILKYPRLVRQLRWRLRETIAKGEKTANPALQLEEEKAYLKLVLEDTMVLAEVRKECLESLGRLLP